MLGVVANSPKQFCISVTPVMRSIPTIFREEAPVWYDNPSCVEIRVESVVIGSRDQLRHIASVKL